MNNDVEVTMSRISDIVVMLTARHGMMMLAESNRRNDALYHVVFTVAIDLQVVHPDLVVGYVEERHLGVVEVVDLDHTEDFVHIVGADILAVVVVAAVDNLVLEVDIHLHKEVRPRMVVEFHNLGFCRMVDNLRQNNLLVAVDIEVHHPYHRQRCSHLYRRNLHLDLATDLTYRKLCRLELYDHRTLHCSSMR